MGRILDLIEKVGNIQVEPFVAPVPSVQAPGQVLLSTRVDEMTFRYAVMVRNRPDPPNFVSPGWYIFHATPDRLTAAYPVDSMMLPVQKMNQLPRFAVIALYPVRPTVWLVMPYNRSDVRQRGWRGEPRELHLVREALLPLDVVWARELGVVLLYDRLDDCLLSGNQSAQAVARQMRDSIVDGGEVLPGISPELYDAILTYRCRMAEQAANEQSPTSVAEQVKRWLDFVGAEYLAHESVFGRYKVHFMIDGHPHWAEVDPSMTVQSLGFCVRGTESRHTLTSAVQVIRDAVAELHPGADQLVDDDDGPPF